MSRTPLFRVLRRSRRLASVSLRTGQSPREVAEAWADRKVTRRRFLGTGAAAAASAALWDCRSLPGASPSPVEVVIVGAGIAGLTAAYRLRQANVPVRVFEAQGRAGGRMYSLRDHFADGQVVELGGELIDTPHERIRALAEELQIPLDDLTEPDPAKARETWFFEGQARTEADIVEAFRPVAARIEADLATLGGDGDVTHEAPNGGERLDGMSIAQWLDGAGVSGWFRRLLDVAYTTEYGLPTDRQSALNFLLMIDPNPEPFKIFGESDERFHVQGGNDRIVSTLAERLGSAVETGVRLEALTARADGSLLCELRREGRSETLVASQVLLALPFTLLRDVRLNVEMPAAKREAIRELGYGTNAKLMVGFTERFWRQAGANGSVLTDLPFQLTWETSRGQEGRAGILTNFTGGAHGIAVGQGTAAAQALSLVNDLDRLFPGASNHRQGMKEVRFHWPTNPFTRGSYASYLTGQWTALRGVEGQSVGNLHFAGEHCSLEAQGFMEGGCETGEAAARAILEQLGRPVATMRSWAPSIRSLGSPSRS